MPFSRAPHYQHLSWIQISCFFLLFLKMPHNAQRNMSSYLVGPQVTSRPKAP